MKKTGDNKKIAFLILGVLLAVILSVSLFIFYSPKESFSAKTFLIKVNIPLGGEITEKINLVNNKDISQKFKVYFNDFKDFGSIQESEFILEAGKSKEIEIKFKDSLKKVGIYPGEVIVESDLSVKKIPVVVGVEDPNQIFAIIQKIMPEYSSVSPGESFEINIKVFDIGQANISSIKAKHYIINLDGEKIWSDEGNLVVGGDITKTINIPVEWGYGDYIFVTSIEHKGFNSISGQLFAISEKEGNIFSENIRFFSFVVVFFVFVIFILFFYFIQTRDNLLIELKRQQDQELKKNLELINISRREIKESEESLKKQEKIKKLEKIKKKVIKKIKHKQKTQRDIIKRLKKTGKSGEIKRTINNWKSQGYKMFESEQKEISKLSGKKIKSQIKNLERRGYATSFLKRK